MAHFAATPLSAIPRRGETMIISCAWMKSLASAGLIALAACTITFTLAGCERKERVLDIQTPGTDVEVDRNIDTGEVEVNVDDN
jgi:hypothetical protein